MAKGFKHGAGGIPLNFKVVGGTTAPSNPKENMIWVDTNTPITGYLFTPNDPNLLDFNLWANNLNVYEGTKIVSNNTITLMSTGTDCRAGDSFPIPCKAGKTYIVEWDFSGNGDAVILVLSNGNGITGAVAAPSEAKKLEYTASEDVTSFTLRIDVGSAPGESGTYSNIRIYEKGQKVMPGTVWITTGTSSNVAFNATKKNTIMVYPIAAKQYIGGAWVDKPAKSYQGGELVPWWNGELYLAGNEFESVTGGWVTRFDANGSTMITEASITKNADSITLSTNGFAQGYISTRNPINLTDYKTLHVDVSDVTVLGREGSLCQVVVCPIDFRWIYSPENYAAILNLSTGQDGLLSIPLDGIDGNYYIALHIAASYSGANQFTVSEVRCK